MEPFNFFGLKKNPWKILFLSVIVSVFFFYGCKNTEETEFHLKADNLINELNQIVTEDTLLIRKLSDSLYNLSVKSGYEFGRLKALFFKGRYFNFSDKHDEAIAVFKEGLSSSIKINNIELQSDFIHETGRAYYRQQKHLLAIDQFQKALELRKQTTDSAKLASSIHNIGLAYWNMSQFDTALVYFKRSLEIRKNLPENIDLAYTYNNIGTIYYNWASYEQALSFYLPALRILKNLNHIDGIGRALCNIGLVYLETERTSKALDFFRESLSYTIPAGNREVTAYAYTCIGNAYKNSLPDSSRHYYNMALKEYTAVNYIGGILLSLKGIGELNISLRNYDLAKKYFERILETAEKKDIKMRVSEANKYLGDIALAEHNYSNAIVHYKKCIEIATNQSILLLLRDAYKNIGTAYANLHDFKSAYEAEKKYEEYNYKIENERISKRLDELKISYERQKFDLDLQAKTLENERQRLYLIVTVIIIAFLFGLSAILYLTGRKRKIINILLEEKNALIEGQQQQLSIKNEELMTSNQAKDKLFSIIAHDLKSPFNALINYSAFLRQDYGELDDATKLEFITALENTSKMTYELLENLLHYAMSQTGKLENNPGTVSLYELSEKSCRLYESSTEQKGIKIINNVPPDLTAWADEHMIDIVIRNLVNNAVKFCEKGDTIELSGEVIGDKICLSVQDTGIGMDENIKNNLFKTIGIKGMKGTKGEKGTGLGLGLCKEFIEKNNGIIAVESEPGKGSRFYFYLPRSK